VIRLGAAVLVGLCAACGSQQASDGGASGGADGTTSSSSSGSGGNLPASCGDSRCQQHESCMSCEDDCGPCNPGAPGDLGHAEGDTLLAFDDITASVGLGEPLDCMMGHAAAFGDVDADGFPDLFFGTFADRPSEEYLCPSGARPNRLFDNGMGSFTHHRSIAIEQRGRASGAAFVDLDGDGDLDLVVSHNSRSSGGAEKTLSNLVFRNDGGAFSDVTAGSSLGFTGMAARNVVVLDYDGDGRLDLFVVGDMFGAVGSRLLRNEGGFVFSDATAAAGLPTDMKGLGAAAADVTGDGWPDLYLSHVDRLYVNDGAGSFVHAAALDALFSWSEPGNEDWRCGVAFGDVNRDGRLDLVVAHHYGSARNVPVPIRLYLNRGMKGAFPTFEDVTAAAGLTPIGSKAPHVEIQDMDNDGWADIYVSVHVEQPDVADAVRPLVFLNEGLPGATPSFAAAPFTVVGDGVSVLGYGAAGPTGDYDRDGRLDVLVAEWFANQDSTLYRNTSAAGNYLEVALRPLEPANPQGIGARVELFEAGALGSDAARIGTSEVMVGFGYSSGQEAVAHFGLADRELVDLRVTLPHGGEEIVETAVAANQRIVVP
jgi:hypothetical protein